MLVFGCFYTYIRQIFDRYSTRRFTALHGRLRKRIFDMTRKVRDANLDTKNARRKLKVRGRPYYRSIAPQLHLGYRKLKNDSAGTWIARHYVGGRYQNEKIGIADDLTEADGTA